MINKLFYGKPVSVEYDLILDMFSNTKINSWRTSSIPLVQYWKNSNARLNQLLCKLDSNLSFNKETSICFEYPTKPQLGKGKSSMTDLMILCGNWKIAVEAKFTEYTKKERTKKIKNWEIKGDNPDNRKLVLEYWKSQIMNFSYGLSPDNMDEIDYQFFHRTASACHDSELACVVYQIFYDEKTQNFVGDYIDELRRYVRLINPNEKLKFLVWIVETQEKPIIKVEKNPFLLMNTNDIYHFGKEELFEL